MSKTINKAKQTMTFAGTNETKPETIRSNFVVNVSNNAHNIVSTLQIGAGATSKTPKNLILYIHGLSAPSRAVWMAAKAANIPVTIRYLDLFKGEHKTPEFAKVRGVKSSCIEPSKISYKMLHDII